MVEDKQLTTSNSVSLNEPQDKEVMEIENAPTILININENMQPTEEAEASHTSALKNKPLDVWTDEEIFYLYLGIKYKGSKNLKLIQENIPTKSLSDIEAAITHFKEKAHQNPDCASRKMKIRRGKTKQLIPLTSWAKVLTDNLNYNELQTEIVSAIRLIAELDDIPPSTWTDQIDFRKVYHQIADAMEGKSTLDNNLVAEVLYSCILETALHSKHFINLTTFKNIVGSINFKEKSMAVLPRPTKDCELTIVRHLASQENYNPLGIPEDNLLPMSNEPVVHPK